MILDIFILILAIERIAGVKKPPPPKPPSPWANWDWTAWRPSKPPVECQVGQRFWCSRDGVPPDPRLYIGDPDYYGPKPMPIFFGPFFPIPPVKCGPSPIIPPVKVNAPDPDGPGPVNVPDLPHRPIFPPYDPDWPKPPIFYGPFVPIPPVKCGPFVPIPPVKCGPSPIIPPVKRKKPYDPDSGCGPEPYSPRDPTRPKPPGKRLLPYCLCCKINQMTQLT